jgi:hypothetical protein
LVCGIFIVNVRINGLLWDVHVRFRLRRLAQSLQRGAVLKLLAWGIFIISSLISGLL